MSRCQSPDGDCEAPAEFEVVISSGPSSETWLVCALDFAGAVVAAQEMVAAGELEPHQFAARRLS